MLSKGMVPTARVAPFLRRYLEESGEPGAEAHGSLPRILKKWETEKEWAEFGSVDDVFCKISDAPAMLWREIPDVYYGCNVNAAPSSLELRVQCKNGHSLKKYLKVRPSGRKVCSECDRKRQRDHQRKKRAQSASRMVA